MYSCEYKEIQKVNEKKRRSHTHTRTNIHQEIQYARQQKECPPAQNNIVWTGFCYPLNEAQTLLSRSKKYGTKSVSWGDFYVGKRGHSITIPARHARLHTFIFPFFRHHFFHGTKGPLEMLNILSSLFHGAFSKWENVKRTKKSAHYDFRISPPWQSHMHVPHRRYTGRYADLSDPQHRLFFAAWGPWIIMKLQNRLIKCEEGHVQFFKFLNLTFVWYHFENLGIEFGTIFTFKFHMKNVTLCFGPTQKREMGGTWLLVSRSVGERCRGGFYGEGWYGAVTPQCTTLRSRTGRPFLKQRVGGEVGGFHGEIYCR